MIFMGTLVFIFLGYLLCFQPITNVIERIGFDDADCIVSGEFCLVVWNFNRYLIGV